MWKLPNRELVRIDEAARYAVVNERTIRRWAEHGIIEKVTIPSGQPRITRESLLASPVVNEHLAMTERENEARKAEAVGEEPPRKRGPKPKKRKKD